MTKAKKKLTKFDFSGDSAHVALVHRDQGGGANMYKTLITKATDVRLELSMEEFLRRFFDMWWDDAEFLAKLLGYEVESDSYENEVYEWKHPLEDKVTVMKKAKQDGISSLSDTDKEVLAEAVQKLSGFSNVTVKDIDQYVAKNAGGDAPVSDIEKGNVADNNIPDTQENNMEQIEKSAVEALIQKALEEQKAEIEKAVAEKESKIEELTKSLAAFEAEKAAQKQAEFVAKAADFEVLGVEDKESFGVALMKMSEQEELAGVMAVLEKAVQIAKGVEGLGEVGHDLEPEEEQISGVMKAIQAKKSAK